MIVDFHTHTFPDKIAEKTIKFLTEKANSPAYREGTLQSLKDSMQKYAIDYSVILPVATKPSQAVSINRLAAEENGKDGIIYAGAIHPDSENVEEILDEVKKAGLFGIKIHPDYQDTYFDDPKYIHIMAEAAKRNLVTVTHAGLDVGYPEDIHCTPDMVLHVLDELKGLIDDKLVLAHMGGCDLQKEVLEKLCGKPVYFDTAFVLDRYYDDCKTLIQAHGADRILFATDSPWSDQEKYIRLIQSYGFSPEDLDKILWQNALKITNRT